MLRVESLLKPGFAVVLLTQNKLKVVMKEICSLNLEHVCCWERSQWPVFFGYLPTDGAVWFCLCLSTIHLRFIDLYNA